VKLWLFYLRLLPPRPPLLGQLPQLPLLVVR
jgi:hypothetical protein